MPMAILRNVSRPVSDMFFIQTRITWKNQSHLNKDKTWKNETSDIWFATKTDEFLFKQHPVGVNTIERPHQDNMESNLWVDIPINHDDEGHLHQDLFTKILDASSFKLNWVLDPFMGLAMQVWHVKRMVEGILALKQIKIIFY
ncbi:hypothetical protein Ct9H90mP29_18210 [bacterium]|nr:MAG: hypothetical protein Ct9H90mP29_18210 [bacterium]